MSAAEAIRTVRMHRDIHPNEGFLQQLADLDNELRRERSLYYWSRIDRFQSSPYDSGFPPFAFEKGGRY